MECGVGSPARLFCRNTECHRERESKDRYFSPSRAAHRNSRNRPHSVGLNFRFASYSNLESEGTNGGQSTKAKR